MGLTEEQLQDIYNYASTLLSPAEIAILLDIPECERKGFGLRCRMQEGCAEYNAFHKGRLQTKLELRKTIIKLAKAGSPAAEPLALKFINEQLVEK